MESIGSTLEHTFSSTYAGWIGAGLVTLACGLLGVLVRRFARVRYERLAATERTEVLEVPLLVISKTSLIVVLVLSLAAGLSTLQLPAKLAHLIASATTIAMFLQLGIWVTSAVITLLEVRRRSALARDKAAVGSLGIIGFVLRVVIWSLMLLLTLENLGVDVTTLVAGLGVGGIAVALAVQNLLGDLFASLSITLDKPFAVGDFLIVGDMLGTVEHIGIKSVRLRSLSGEQLIIANTDLLTSRVRNYSRMEERRVVFTIRTPYETPLAKIRKVPELLEAAVRAEENTRFDRGHFARYGEFALEFEVVYYVLDPSYNVYADIQQRINFTIHEAFEREGIAFAVPTQKLWLNPLKSGRRATRTAADRDASDSDEDADAHAAE